MNKAEKLKFLKNLKDEMSLHEILKALLPAIGFKDLTYSHKTGGKSEFGKDFVAYLDIPALGSKDWYAFVVKKGDLSGSSSFENVRNQIDECFNYEYNSLSTGRISINKVIVICNGNISNNAEEKILKLRDRTNLHNVLFWDNEKLYNLIEEHKKELWITGSFAYKEYMAYLKSIVRKDSYLKSLGKEGVKVEKLLDNLIPLTLQELRPLDSKHLVKSHKPKLVNLPLKSMIVGESGSGKSTLFRTMITDVIDITSLTENAEIWPILINFRDLFDSNFDLHKTLLKALNVPELKELIYNAEDVINSNNIIVFIDSLDEIGEENLREKAIKAVSDYSKIHPSVKIICASRPSDVVITSCYENGFTHLEIQGVSISQIDTFFEKFFSEKLDKKELLRNSIVKTGILNKLPNTPLTMSLLAILFDESDAEIPATISDLYKYFVDMLLGKNTVINAGDIIDYNVKLRAICLMALYMHTNHKNKVNEEELLNHLILHYKSPNSTLDVTAVFKSIIQDSGLMFKDTSNKISFKHISFQEFLSALEIYKYQAECDYLYSLNTVWWQNVTIFYAGLVKDSPKIVKEILAGKYQNTIKENILLGIGLGQLNQALYLTNETLRENILDKSLEAFMHIFQEIVTGGDKNLDYLRRFSRYFITLIVGYTFENSHTSITMKGILNSVFNKLAAKKNLNPTDEIKLFAIGVVLTNKYIADYSTIQSFLLSGGFNSTFISAAFAKHLELNSKELGLSLENKNLLKTMKKSIDGKLSKISKDVKNLNEEINKPVIKIKNRSIGN